MDVYMASMLTLIYADILGKSCINPNKSICKGKSGTHSIKITTFYTPASIIFNAYKCL